MQVYETNEPVLSQGVGGNQVLQEYRFIETCVGTSLALVLHNLLHWLYTLFTLLASRWSCHTRYAVSKCRQASNLPVIGSGCVIAVGSVNVADGLCFLPPDISS